MRWLLLCAGLLGCPKAPSAADPAVAAWAHMLPARGVVSEVARSGDLASRLSPAPADLVIFYTGEERGSLRTCGCPRRPRGSLARFIGQLDAARAAMPAPNVVVHAGSWLADAVDYMGQPRLDAREMDRWMMRGMDLAGFDAINVSTQDVAGLLTVDEGLPLPLVSANLDGPGIARWQIVTVEGQRVGITGVTGGVMPLADTGAYRLRSVGSAASTLGELASQVDVVILLSWDATEAVRQLTREVPVIDVVIDASIHDDALDAAFLGKTLFAFSVYQGVQLGELRLDLEAGEVVAALDRHVDLDDVIPGEPSLVALEREARTAIEKVQVELYGP